MDPLLPLDAEPDFTVIAPLTPLDSEFNVCNVKAPLLEPVPLPDEIETDPPVRVVLEPALTTSLPPAPSSPVPTTTLILPPAPLVANPDIIMIEPDDPSFEEPL